MSVDYYDSCFLCQANGCVHVNIIMNMLASACYYWFKLQNKSYGDFMFKFIDCAKLFMHIQSVATYVIWKKTLKESKKWSLLATMIKEASSTKNSNFKMR